MCGNLSYCDRMQKGNSLELHATKKKLNRNAKFVNCESTYRTQQHRLNRVLVSAFAFCISLRGTLLLHFSSLASIHAIYLCTLAVCLCPIKLIESKSRIIEEWGESEDHLAREKFNGKHDISLTEYEELLPEETSSITEATIEPFEDGDCVAMHEWQLLRYPTCNILHEVDLTSLRSMGGKMLNRGAYRDGWMITETGGESLALKTMRYEKDYTERFLEIHRRDALAYERLTSSPNVVTMFSYCGTAGIYEYSKSGSLDGILKYLREKEEEDDREEEDESSASPKLAKLVIAHQIAAGIADMHDSEKDGRAAFAHLDVASDQFLVFNGKFKLSDFNRCRFLTMNKETKESCGYGAALIDGLVHAPEIYQRPVVKQTEKVDVFSLGHVFYELLTGLDIFEELDIGSEWEEEVPMYYNIAQGARPSIPFEVLISSDPVDVILTEAIRMCYIHDPDQRPTARELYHYLSAELASFAPEAVNGASIELNKIDSTATETKLVL